MATADFKTKDSFNSHCMYADDCYILIPMKTRDSVSDEINNFTAWAYSKGLVVNQDKTKVMCCSYNKHYFNLVDMQFPHAKVKLEKYFNVLGVSFANNLSFTCHIDKVIAKCNHALYANYILLHHGLNDKLRRDFYFALVLSQINYCIAAWIGFTKQQDKSWLARILHKGHKLKLLDPDVTLDSLVNKHLNDLFKDVVSRPIHVLHHMLPPVKDVKYYLRNNSHSFQLPELKSPHDMCNYFLHMLYL